MMSTTYGKATFFFFQAEDGIRDLTVTGVQTCALPICFLYLTPEGVARDFAPDLPAAQTNVMAATQGPIFGKAFDEKVTNAAWKIKPSWFIVAEKDRMIQPELQRAMAKKIGASMTALPTSHVAMLSRPKEVAAVILAAAGIGPSTVRNPPARPTN